MIQFDQTLFLILLTTGILGINAGMIGTFLVLSKKSLFGDTIAHATLPGLTGIFFYTMSKNPLILICSATISALFAAVCIDQLEHKTTLKKDTILGIILATSFGLGTVFLSKIQTIPDAHQAGLTKYLLGNASTLLHQDLIMISITTLFFLFFIFNVYKQYKILLFDSEFAATSNIATRTISYLMLLLTTLTIVIGLQTVGIILISALLIAPAIAARQWSHTFETIIFLSAFFGMISTTAGTLISSSMMYVPTGPTIVIVATMITFFSILFAPQGIIITWLKQQKHIQKMDEHAMLKNFLLFNEGLKNPFHAHDLKALQAVGKKSTNKIIATLEVQGLITSPQKNFWQLTPQGLKFLKDQCL
ncbi:metal ABC transporter permease [Candidatus Babeliales bacterium]|nr:metal ABC transporter permease [Candidatus Babeliales bacterium]